MHEQSCYRVEHFATGQFLPVKDAIAKECFNDITFDDAFYQTTDILECLVAAGFQYLSSILWGGMIPYSLHLTSHQDGYVDLDGLAALKQHTNLEDYSWKANFEYKSKIRY